MDPDRSTMKILDEMQQMGEEVKDLEETRTYTWKAALFTAGFRHSKT